MPEHKSRLRLTLPNLNSMIDKAIYGNWHNVIIIWAELGKGKTSLMMRCMYRILKKIWGPKAWEAVLSFNLEPHVCGKCGYRWDSGNPYRFEVPCPKCGETKETKDIMEAVKAVYQKMSVDPFPFDYNTGLFKKFDKNQKFIINSSRARGTITQKYPYMNFSFDEMRTTVKKHVDIRVRLPIIGWDDIAVYFHRSNIQYMHPYVKNFFSRYNFIRKYVANVLLTVPDPEFVPEQLCLFCTADIMLLERGKGDFDVKKKRRSFWGKSKTWTKHYDGRNVKWDAIPDDWFTAYEEIRHAHSVIAFEKPEEVLVTTMPKEGKEFTEQESLF